MVLWLPTPSLCIDPHSIEGGTIYDLTVASDGLATKARDLDSHAFLHEWSR